MKSHGFTKRLLTLIFAAAILISNQTILFAAQTGDLQGISEGTPEMRTGRPNTQKAYTKKKSLISSRL